MSYDNTVHGLLREAYERERRSHGPDQYFCRSLDSRRKPCGECWPCRAGAALSDVTSAQPTTNRNTDPYAVGDDGKLRPPPPEPEDPRLPALRAEADRLTALIAGISPEREHTTVPVADLRLLASMTGVRFGDRSAGCECVEVYGDRTPSPGCPVHGPRIPFDLLRQWLDWYQRNYGSDLPADDVELAYLIDDTREAVDAIDAARAHPAGAEPAETTEGT